MQHYPSYPSRREQHLSQDCPATYQIIIQGQLGPDWSDWFEGMTIAPAADQKEPLTTLTGLVTDQAALHGLLNRLYGLGLPLLSIKCLGVGAGDEPGSAEVPQNETTEKISK